MKNLKITIKLESVSAAAEEKLPDAINETITNLFFGFQRHGGEIPFTAEWDIKVMSEYNGKGHPDMCSQNSMFAEEEINFDE